MSPKVVKIVTVDVVVAVADVEGIVEANVVDMEAEEDLTMIEAVIEVVIEEVIEVTEEVLMTVEEVMTMVVAEDGVLTKVAEEEVEVDLIKNVEEETEVETEEETNLAATLISADAIEEIQTGDLPPKMTSERLPQKKPRLDPGLNCYHER